MTVRDTLCIHAGSRGSGLLEEQKKADKASIVDYTVFGPGKGANKETVIMDGEKEREGDFVFTATETGEYRFCFDNSVSTFSDKMVYFEINVWS